MGKKKSIAPSPIHSRYSLRPDGGWADQLACDVSEMSAGEQAAWFALLDHLADAAPQDSTGDWQKAQAAAEHACFSDPEYPPVGIEIAEPGSDEFRRALKKAGPSLGWFETLQTHLNRLSCAAVSSRLSTWIRAATRSGVGTLNRPGPNRAMLRALLWGSTLLGSPSCADALRELGTFAMSHNTAQGSLVALVLASTETEDSLGALHLLAQSAKRPWPRSRSLRAAEHVARCLGLTADDAAERFVPRYELGASGARRVDFGSARAEICLRNSGIEVLWYDSKGKQVKATPAAVRKTDPSRLAELKASVKAMGSMLLAQRDRLDHLLRERRAWPLAYFKTHYLEHPLVGHLARRLIWIVDGVPVLFVAGRAIDVNGNPVGIADTAEVRPWHPVDRTAEEVLAWRRRLELLEITQPFKQAHREIYILTEAERRTRTYSNRFAGHILRQHQFAQLARGRGWVYALQGVWDTGGRSAATCRSPGTEFRAEFWVTPTDMGGHTGAGIELQVATDQVRFYRGDDRDPLPLDQIPPLVFSEILRDVDLFVVVASVGNDPTWQDGGPEGRYRTYWHSYSFGELSETANTRKAVLERLLPRLTKIRDRCTLSDRFLVVRGDLRTYKIHLGSGNILMEPNDQYLCIVPSRSAADGASNVFLPFEGDATLSIILSKAFLLAEDRKIKDETITRQITRGS